MPTKTTQIRLTDQDRDDIEDLRRRYGLPSMAAAIRFAVKTVRRGDYVPRENNRKKSGEST